MNIAFIEIANFRKLLAVRVDLSSNTTLLVGANNSGKTSALVALRKFLTPKGRPFEMNDITLCHHADINAVGQDWIARDSKSTISFMEESWAKVLPALDLWLNVEEDEIHHVRDLIPDLEFVNGEIGVRLRLEPKDFSLLFKDFVDAATKAENLKAIARERHPENSEKPYSELKIWPSNLVDFLARRMSDYLTIRAYPLDPSKLQSPEKLRAFPQQLPETAWPLDGNPISGLIRVDDIQAQRGFGEVHPDEAEDVATVRPSSGANQLSEQLRAYYKRHLDPTNSPDPKDLDALQAIDAAQEAFNLRLTESFEPTFTEVRVMGYPGGSDPRPLVATKLKAIDGLNHTAAVSFEVTAKHENSESKQILLLPEGSNGLGYQNLISMIFRLMSFRDAWMRVGKANSDSQRQEKFEPLHLVLIEEPEAHLHAQVQQVFIKKAYQVLRAHVDLKESTQLTTQLVVSTHSSHVAHEIPFDKLRYFRRIPAGMVAPVPTSSVVNLSTVFGAGSNTRRFVTRYLRAHHSDLFFADAAIIVEGAAERMLLPHFISMHHKTLNERYLSILELGGSHAHRLRELIEALGLTSLIITDIDALERTAGASVQPNPKSSQVTNNATLKGWIPQKDTIDELYAQNVEKTYKYDEQFEVRSAYQIPLEVNHSSKKTVVYPYTFEDALVFENLSFFKNQKDGVGLIKKFQGFITAEKDAIALGKKFFDELKKGDKAAFALDVMDSDEFSSLTVPAYITEGLQWLEGQLENKRVEVLSLAGSGI